MLAVTHFAAAPAEFAARAERALRTLAARPGFVRGQLARSTDDVGDWVLVTEWADVGSYRRALGAYEVKLHATALLGEALDLPASFEPLLVAPGDGRFVSHASDRAEPDA